MRRLIPLLAFVLIVALAPPASAERVNDPDDTRGKLDVSLLAGHKRTEHSDLGLRLETYENWDCARLGRPGNRVQILLDVDADPGFDYVGKISCFVREGPAFMDIFPFGGGSLVDTIRVPHPDGHTLKMTIPRGSEVDPRGAVRLVARTHYQTETGGCSHGCHDRAPDAGLLEVG